MKINNNEYKVIKDYNGVFILEEVTSRLTEYYDIYDYVVGDWAYGKLRLKGFYEKDNKNALEHNLIDNVDDYIENKCAFGCKYFIIKKLAKNK